MAIRYTYKTILSARLHSARIVCDDRVSIYVCVCVCICICYMHMHMYVCMYV
jgi:hypothetical protein